MYLCKFKMALLIRALNVKQCACMDCHETSKKIQKTQPEFGMSPSYGAERISNGFNKFGAEDQHVNLIFICQKI
jgi:formate-dependent nitrite reductase cytochrome c552 subunit